MFSFIAYSGPYMKSEPEPKENPPPKRRWIRDEFLNIEILVKFHKQKSIFTTIYITQAYHESK